MSEGHALLPQASHDERAEQLFVRDLKSYVAATIEPLVSTTADQLDPGAAHNARAEETYRQLQQTDGFADYLALRRASQNLLWSLVSHSVERQRDALDAAAAAVPARGSLTLDPDFVQPAYLADRDVHLMPGGYARDPGGVAQGALMDRGGAVYMLGRNGGFLNDGRGWTLASHLKTRWPEHAPGRMLELGCGIGASTVPVALAFPDAEVHALDVGNSMLRYAHARASELGATIHFHQGNAEATPYPDASFDCVFTCVVLHETSQAAIGAIMKECARLLKQGGVVAHLEVPQRYDSIPLWTQVRGEIELDYNNEPNWKTAISADYAAHLAQAGFIDIETGFQDAARSATAGDYSAQSKGVFHSWFVASGRKPAS